MNNPNSQHLTKRQRRLLKRQQEEQERLQLKKRKKIKKIVALVLPVVLVVGVVIFISANSPVQDNQETPKIQINPLKYDAGTVSMADGLVKHTYEVTNNGSGDLKINSISTSCMCTTAVLKVGDRESPEFGMHNNPAFWSEKIAPGETGLLQVAFDPAFHGPQGTGPVTRAVYLSTNDLDNRKIEVKLTANVTL